MVNFGIRVSGEHLFFVTINGYSQESPHNRMYATRISDVIHLIAGQKLNAVADESVRVRTSACFQKRRHVIDRVQSVMTAFNAFRRRVNVIRSRRSRRGSDVKR